MHVFTQMRPREMRFFFLSWNKHEQRGKTDTKTAKEKFLEKIAAKRKTASSFNLK